jgi:uncharacterized membrane protein
LWTLAVERNLHAGANLMKKVIALIVASLALILGSRWAFTSGAEYELRGLSPPERMSVLDTTTINEKWMLIGGGMMALATIFLILAIIFYFRNRKKAFG